MAADLPIHWLSRNGEGVHSSERGPIYIDRALPGDSVQAKIHGRVGDVVRGDLIRVVTTSPHRVKAPCPNYDVCGGCTLQHADEDFYRNWKVGTVRAALDKKGLTPGLWRDPVFLAAGQRRRVTFAAFKKKNAVTLGYFRRRSHQVTDIASCLVADSGIMDLRARLVPSLAALLQDGKTADIFIQTLNGQFEVVVTGPVGRKGRPDLQVHETFAQMVHQLGVDRISWRAHERDIAEVMVENASLRATFGTLKVILPPLAFLQPTKAGEDALIDAVLELLPGTGKFADLFAGCGTFSGPMLGRGPVDAFESLESAVHALDKSKGTMPLRAFRRDLFRTPLLPEEAGHYDAIVFDPPRAGAHDQVKALAASEVPLLIGVSCNPITFARDARILVDGRYVLESVRIIDQFAWSHHVELVAAFRKRP